MGLLAKVLYIYGATRPKPSIFMGLLAPSPRKFFEKKSAVPTPNIVRSDIKILTFVPDVIEFLQYSTKNFQTGFSFG